MKRFTVTVRTLTGSFSFPAIGYQSGAIATAAAEIFGLCGVTVLPVRPS